MLSLSGGFMASAINYFVKKRRYFASRRAHFACSIVWKFLLVAEVGINSALLDTVGATNACWKISGIYCVGTGAFL